MSLDDQLIERYTQGARMPSEGQHGFLASGRFVDGVGWIEYFDPTNAQAYGFAQALEHAGLWVQSVWGGSPVQPTIIYNQTVELAANELTKLNVPRANRQAWITSQFSIANATLGPVTYTGPSGVYIAVEWSLQLQVVTNPNRLCFFGVQVDAETTPRAEFPLLINGSAGTRYQAIGTTPILATTGMTFWPACRPYNGTLPANNIGFEELSMNLTTLGTATLET